MHLFNLWIEQDNKYCEYTLNPAKLKLRREKGCEMYWCKLHVSDQNSSYAIVGLLKETTHSSSSFKCTQVFISEYLICLEPDDVHGSARWCLYDHEISF